jgi:hypothetical protein
MRLGREGATEQPWLALPTRALLGERRAGDPGRRGRGHAALWVCFCEVGGGGYASGQSVCWEVFNEVVQISVVDPVLATEVVLDGDGEGLNEVDDGLLLDEDTGFEGVFAVACSRPYGRRLCACSGLASQRTRMIEREGWMQTWNVEPDQSRKRSAVQYLRKESISRCSPWLSKALNYLAPESPPFIVAFKTGCGPDRDDETCASSQA